MIWARTAMFGEMALNVLSRQECVLSSDVLFANNDQKPSIFVPNANSWKSSKLKMLISSYWMKEEVEKLSLI